MIPAPPLVLIEQGPDVPQEIREGVLDGCAQGLGPDACSDGENAGDGRYHARLIWGENYQTVAIIVVLEQDEQRRKIRFQPQDPADTRGVVAGLVAATAVATHITLTEGEEAPGNPKDSSSASESSGDSTSAPPPPSSPASLAPSPALRADLGVLLDSGLRDGPLGAGVGARLSVHGPFGSAFPVVGLSYSESAGGIRVGRLRTWIGVGVLVRLGEGSVALEPSVAILGEQLFLSATQESATERASRTRFGAIGELDLVWRLSEAMDVFAGPQLATVWPDVEIVESGEVVDRQPVVSWGGLLGGRARF